MRKKMEKTNANQFWPAASPISLLLLLLSFFSLSPSRGCGRQNRSSCRPLRLSRRRRPETAERRARRRGEELRKERMGMPARSSMKKRKNESRPCGTQQQACELVPPSRMMRALQRQRRRWSRRSREKKKKRETFFLFFDEKVKKLTFSLRSPRPSRRRRASRESSAFDRFALSLLPSFFLFTPPGEMGFLSCFCGR